MMNRQEYNHILAERGQLQRLLADVPSEDVLDRMSFEGRLVTIEKQLAEAPKVFQRIPARTRLTFRGKPVVGSHGIFAEFGATALSKFSDAVATVAASLGTTLSATGPIPNRDQNQLLVTSTALGSFGFELEEYLSDQMELVEGPSVLEQALEQTQLLLQGTLGSDDELADSVSGTDPRALSSVRAFLDTLANAEATCSVEYRERVVRFSDVGQVRRSLDRLNKDNLHEEEQLFEGNFQGVLPKRRTFEFKMKDQNEVIVGKVSPSIPDADVLNGLLQQLVRVKMMVTQVGTGRPRFVLIDQPEILGIAANE
jgi:hypothetical protein